ncbi:MAG: hypothetical protein JWN66_2140 [Sphingomonas bacterium]|nr:hypothetical protein [Sphingomonas bacterium]
MCRDVVPGVKIHARFPPASDGRAAGNRLLRTLVDIAPQDVGEAPHHRRTLVGTHYFDIKSRKGRADGAADRLRPLAMRRLPDGPFALFRADWNVRPWPMSMHLMLHVESPNRPSR